MTAEQYSFHGQDLSADQRIRAAAMQSAAAFCDPSVKIEDVIFAADVFAGYIQGGWQRALQVYATGDHNPEPTQGPQDVELREQASPPSGAPAPPEVPASTPPAPPEPGPSTPETTADVIPMSARGKVTEKQLAARVKVDRPRRQRAESFLRQGQSAKAEQHRELLMTDIEKAGLEDFVLEHKGEMRQLGEHLRILWGW